MGNRAHTVIRVTIGRAPVPRETTARKVVDHLDSISKLANNLLIGESGHVRVSPSVHGDVVLEHAEGAVKLSGVTKNVEADHEVCCMHIFRFEEVVELVGVLEKSR